MIEIDQLKKRIDDSGKGGIETARIRDDYEPVGDLMMHKLIESGEYVQRKVPPGCHDQEWLIFKKEFKPY